MTAMQPLLIELGTEELPVKALPGLAQALFDGVLAALEKRGIAVERGAAKPLYSPRRLAVLLPGVAVEQPEQASEVLGPYLNIALDADGRPTKALEGFAAKAGVEWTRLDKLTDAKGERFVHRATNRRAHPRPAAGGVARSHRRDADSLPMRWGDHDYAFARPVHWLVLLLGEDVVETESFGVRADRMSRGHRFLHDKPVWIGAPGDYVDALRGAHVLVDADERRARIEREVHAAAKAAGGTARIDADNLEQVNCLNEWPAAVACAFEREFLAVPQEALVATMETNQKFFPVLDAGGRLTEHFIGIANIEPKDPSEIRKGYERVIRPRFADAKFFFDEDLKQGLAAMGRASRTSPTRRNSARSPTRPNAWPRWPRRSHRRRTSIRNWRAAPRCWRRTTCKAAWSTSSRNCRASPAATTPGRGRSGRGRARHRRGLPAAFRRRRYRALPARQGARDRRTVGHACRAVRRRAQADRQQGSVRAATQCARFGADDYRERIQHRLAGSFVRSLYADPTVDRGHECCKGS